jgi:hypothetical protein
MLVISEQQMNVLQEQAEEDFVRRIMKYQRENQDAGNLSA